jgi:glutathionylspermidine synthase
MERLYSTPRPNWQAQIEAAGLSVHAVDDEIFWNEHACYHFEAREIDEISTATNELESLCLEVVEQVVKHQRYAELHIPEYAWALIESSWRNREQALYGRMDFSYDGTHPPKLLEYNAATPIGLLESSLIQKHWLEEVRPVDSQFNCIHERLVAAWERYTSETIHFTCRDTQPWLYWNTAYLADTAIQAGRASKIVFIEDIQWNGKTYVDEDNNPIKSLFKLCAWEWMLEDVFGKLLQASTHVIEPAWKMILSNKALMVLLWQLFPGHPNLLPAYFEEGILTGNYVKKPLLGRLGDNISLYHDSGNFITDGDFNQGPFIYQQAQLLPNFDGNYALIGSWLIAGKASGILVREDDSPITRGVSRIVPHYCEKI